MPDQVRHDDKWARALARFARAEAALERLLLVPASDLDAVSLKLELILRHSVFESGFGDNCLALLQEDVRRFALKASTRMPDP